MKRMLAGGLMALMIGFGFVGAEAHIAVADHPELAVTIAGFAFDPAEIVVEGHGTVTWTNSDGAAHTVTARDESFDSGRLANGESFTLDTEGVAPGTYEYFCRIHPRMVGTLVVREHEG
jgi:plastocyanin